MGAQEVEKIYIRDDTIDTAVLDDLFELLLADDLVERIEEERAVVRESQEGDWHLSQIQDVAVQGRKSSGNGKNPRPDSQDTASIYLQMVEDREFETLRSASRSRRES